MSLMQQVAKEAQRYVLRKYGNLLSVEDPRFDQKDRIWKVKIKADYPRLIKNEFPMERFLRVLVLEDLGTISLNEELKVIGGLSTPRDECVNTVRARLNTWQKNAESIIVQASSFQLASTSTAHVFLSPIITILSNFLDDNQTIITFEDVDKLRKTERYLQWLYLLEDLQLVRREEKGFTYDNMFTEIQRATKGDEQQFLINVLAYVIRERYPMLKDIFALRQFETLVHLDSCYYTPALEAGKILHRTADSLFKQYQRTFRQRSRLELPRILHELHHSQALVRRNGYYFANETLFDEMLEMSEQYLPLSGPRA